MNFYVFYSFFLGFWVLDFLSPRFLITRAGGVCFVFSWFFYASFNFFQHYFFLSRIMGFKALQKLVFVFVLSFCFFYCFFIVFFSCFFCFVLLCFSMFLLFCILSIYIFFLVHSKFWIRNTYNLTRAWIFLFFTREIEADTRENLGKNRKNKKTRGKSKNSRASFLI